MTEAIKLAIEKGGWKGNNASDQEYPDFSYWQDKKLHFIDYQRTGLDPLFWQALGKALGKLRQQHHEMFF